MTNIKIKIFAAIIVVVLAGGGMYYLKGKPLRQAQGKHASDYFSDLKQLGRKFSGESQKTSENQSSNSSGKLEIYKNSQYGFSFSYPKGFNVSEFDDGGGKIILVKNVGSSVSNNSENGFQIFIAAFDEPFDSAQGKPIITKERILKDIPDMVIINENEIAIGGEKVLSFESKDELGAETREIWMVHPNGASGGFLYQIKGYRNFEKEVLEILSSWRFSS